jgi:predicted ester cyclase
MSEQNVQLCRRFFEKICNKRQRAAADQLFAEGHVYHDPSGPGATSGPAGMKDLMATYHNAVNDAIWDVHAMIDAGDIVVTRWTGRGTHTGELMGIAPTHRKVSIDGI